MFYLTRLKTNTDLRNHGSADHITDVILFAAHVSLEARKFSSVVLHPQDHNTSLIVSERSHGFQHLLFIFRDDLFEFNRLAFPSSDEGLDLRRHIWRLDTHVLRLDTHICMFCSERGPALIQSEIIQPGMFTQEHNPYLLRYSIWQGAIDAAAALNGPFKWRVRRSLHL